MKTCKRCGKEDEIPSDICIECTNEQNQADFEYELRWHENMNSLYDYGEDGFCDGFTNY
jgi:hypothetical protein